MGGYIQAEVSDPPRSVPVLSLGAAVAAASPYQLSGHIHHQAAPEREQTPQ